MFKSKIVFVLGAGASKEIGMPLGDELKTDIAKSLDIRDDGIDNRNISQNKFTGDQRIVEALRKSNKLDSAHIKAAQSISQAMPVSISIDNYLNTHYHDEAIKLCGKLAIVNSILEAEKKSFLATKNDVEDTWFGIFFKLLTENVSKDNIDTLFDNVSIINFNYDRATECFLSLALQKYYGLQEHELIDLMLKLKILHPYGTVGRILKTSIIDQGISLTPYGSHTADILSLSQNIKTFTEAVDDNTLSEIRNIFQTARIIVFLGFAFHDQNLKLLAPRNSSNVINVYGSAYKISESNRLLIEKDLYEVLNNGPELRYFASRNMQLRDLTCADLLNEYSRSLTQA